MSKSKFKVGDLIAVCPTLVVNHHHMPPNWQAGIKPYTLLNYFKSSSTDSQENSRHYVIDPKRQRVPGYKFRDDEYKSFIVANTIYILRFFGCHSHGNTSYYFWELTDDAGSNL